MKKMNLYGLLLFSVALLINSGCSQETLPTVPPTNTVPPIETVPPINTTEPPNLTPNAFAGEDFQVMLPVDFCWLDGGYSNVAANNIDKVLWKKISGPPTYILENPNWARTKVSKLEKGIYEFELTITNKLGVTGIDTVIISVSEMPENQNEFIFNNMVWSCPMGCSIEIKNINSYLPAGSVFQVYIQRDNSANWEKIIQESSELPADVQYTYSLYNGNLYIFIYNASQIEDTPNIKIAY